MTERDHLGRRALFSVPADEVPEEPARAEHATEPDGTSPSRPGSGRAAAGNGPAGSRPSHAPRDAGKRAMFTAGERRSGTVVLECSSCRARSRVTFFEFFRRHLPVWLWFPWRRHSNWISCPACERRTWVAVSWLG